MSLRIGQGYDIHPFVAHRARSGDDQGDDNSRSLVLGGVQIPEAPGLMGHSDADVVAHSLADALLGAAGLGDLGTHFPADRPEWAGADSIELLKAVLTMVEADGWEPVNGDCTVLCERPRLARYLGAMSSCLGSAIGAPVSVKVKSGEGMGAIGRGEGIACLSVVLLGSAGTSHRPPFERL